MKELLDRFRIRILPLVGVVIVPILCAVALFNQQSFLDEILNSDTLLPAALVWDLIHHPGAWPMFQLPRVPSLVPDLLVYGLVQGSSGSWRIAHLAYGVLSLLALTGLSAVIIADLVRCTRLRAAQAFLLVGLPVLGFEMVATQGAEAGLHLLIFYPVSHGGPFLWGLATLIVARGTAVLPQVVRMALVAGMVSVGILSDRLLLLVVVLPLAAEYILSLRQSRIPALLRLAALAGAVMIAWWPLDRLLFRQPDLALVWRDVPDHALRLLTSPVFPLAAEAPATILLCGVLPLAGLFMFRSSVWWRTAMISISASIAATSLVYADVPSYRYLSPLLWWPLIFCAAVLARRLQDRHRPAVALLMGLAAMVSLIAYGAAGLRRPKIMTAQDPLARCLEDAQASQGLRAGLSEYWFARYLAAMSDWRLQIDQITVAGAAYVWGNDPFWYFHSTKDPGRPANYDYLVMVSHPDAAALEGRYGQTLGPLRLNGFLGFDPQAMTAIYGEPDRRLVCPGSHGSTRDRGAEVAIWIYDRPGTVADSLIKVTPSLYGQMLRQGAAVTVSAAQLIGAEPAGHRDGVLYAHGQPGSPVANSVVTSVVTWGPYLVLPAGKFRIGLSYRLDAANPAAQARWAVTFDGGRKILSSDTLPPTGELMTTVWSTITVDQETPGVEVITQLPGAQEIAVGGVEIIPLPR